MKGSDQRKAWLFITTNRDMVCKRIIKILLISASLASPALSAGKVSVSSSLDRSEITVGDLIIYTIEVRHPEGYKITAPPLGSELGEFLIRDFERPKNKKEAGMVIERMSYKITTYITGKVTIPEMTVNWESPSGEKGEVPVSAMEINVRSVTTREALSIRGLKEPVNIPVKMWPYYLAGFGAIAAAIGIAGLAYYLHRRRLRPEAEASPLLITPEELALNALQALKNTADTLIYYSTISETIRRYIETRFYIDALERTTSEIESALKAAQKLPGGVNEDALELLYQADLVKFAKFVPEKSRMKGDLQIAVSIIERTSRPAPEPEAREESAA